MPHRPLNIPDARYTKPSTASSSPYTVPAPTSLPEPGCVNLAHRIDPAMRPELVEKLLYGKITLVDQDMARHFNVRRENILDFAKVYGIAGYRRKELADQAALDPYMAALLRLAPDVGTPHCHTAMQWQDGTVEVAAEPVLTMTAEPPRSTRFGRIHGIRRFFGGRTWRAVCRTHGESALELHATAFAAQWLHRECIEQGARLRVRGALLDGERGWRMTLPPGAQLTLSRTPVAPHLHPLDGDGES